MSDERSQFARKIDERSFSQSRRGYDKTEVKSYLEDLEQAFRELEGHSRRLSQKVAELEQELSKSRATEKVSVDNAMMAVFDAKDRILERARRRADDIEEEARLEAGRIREAAIAEVGGSGATGEIAAARAQADEIIASARREADRLREEVAAVANDGPEADLADMGERLRRAHDENAAVRAELDEARKRIVELENIAPAEDSEQMRQRFAELEELVSAARADADRLRLALDEAQEEREAARREAAEAETTRSQIQASLEAATAELNEVKALAAGATDQTEFDSLQAKLSAAQARVEELADADRLRIEAENRLAEAETRATEAAARIAEAENRASEAAARIAEAENRASEAAARIAEAETRAADAEARVSEVEAKAADAEARVSEVEAKAADAEARVSAAETRAADAEARAAKDRDAASAAQAELVASQARQTTLDETPAKEVEQAEFAGTMAAFEARTIGALAHRENLALIAETSRANIHVPSEDIGGAEHADAQAEAERIVAAAREEAEAIKDEAEEQADQRAAKVIARAREEADQVRQTVATLTAQADNARSAALRSKLEAEDLAEAQKAMSEARDQIIATAEKRAEGITQDAERVAANLRAEAAAALEGARAEAERIVATAGEEAKEKMAEAVPVADAEPELGSGLEPEQDSSAGSETSEPQQPRSGDELAALLAEAEQDLAANEKLRRERERLDAQEAELAAQRAEAILLAATRDGGFIDSATATDTTNAEIESGVQELVMQSDKSLAAIDPVVEATSEDVAEREVESEDVAEREVESEDVAEREVESEDVADREVESEDVTGTEAEPDDAVDAPPPRIEFNDILDMEDATSLEEPLEDGDEDEEDPADLLTALLEEVAPMGGLTDDDATAESEEAALERAPAEDQEVVQDLSHGPGPRVAWPSPVDLDEKPEDGPQDGNRQSRYRSRSAQLPRLGQQAKSNMTSMANLRKKSRGDDDD